MTAAAPKPSGPNELVGAVLSRKYTLKRVIGSGGMGAVFEAQSTGEARAVAVKILGVEYLHDADIKARFLEEGRTCQRLIHPNIVRVHDVADAEDGTPYIVMELLEGVPLSAYTRSAIRVPVQQAATILQGILAGLGAAHAQNVVHRDLKPENVVLAREAGGTFTAKILDFGIAKVMDAAGGMGSKTRTGVLLGTPAYMSPEQIKNAKDVDARADLWSAGVMLYEMLTGRVAFPAPTEYARLNAVLSTNPAPVESVDPSLARLSAFIQLAMQKDRAQRFQSALEMARALSAAMGEAGTAPTPISRLPDVPSVFMPMQPTPAVGPATAATTQAAIAPATIATAPPVADPTTGPGGTLTSRPARAVSDPPPQVVIASIHGTLPSENLPMLSAPGGRPAARGVAVWIVVLLVLAALGAGFFLGYATARSL